MGGRSHTEEKLLKALNNMEDEKLPKHDNLRKAGYCRTKSDWLMGALLTAKATVELGSGKILSLWEEYRAAVLPEIVRVERTYHAILNPKKILSYSWQI